MAVDIFDLLDVSRREDSYTCVLASVLRASEPLRARVLREAFPGQSDHEATGPDAVRFRRGLQGEGITDLVLEGTVDGRPAAVFVEAKIDAGEGHRQTERYLRALVRHVGPHGCQRRAESA